jgi:aspartyl-tRNA(Asn)/glutamyl-tRNA(Gln) amidotransferase subunit C
MKISLEEVRRIARLAHLEFSDAELGRLAGELDRILDYVGQLGQLDVEGVDPAAAVSPASQPLRPDRLLPCLTQEQALAGAPRSGRGHFQVPRVIG